MSKIKIYHNPRCSKSRETLALLQDKGQQPEVIEYLKDAPTAGDLLEIIDILEGEPASLVRTKEDRYRELKFDLTSKETIA